MMATTSHAARNPNVPTTTIHGMSTSPSFISGRLRVRAKKLMRLIWLTSTGSSKRSRHLRRGRKFRARGFRRLNPEGMPDLLSRRDRMIVARQFIAWNPFSKRDPSRRDGMIGSIRLLPYQAPDARTRPPSNRSSYRPLRDGLHGYGTPGNELPGYDHSIPTGQSPTAPYGTRLSTPLVVR